MKLRQAMKQDSRDPLTCPDCGEKLPSGDGAHGLCPHCAWLGLADAGDAFFGDALPGLPGLCVLEEMDRGGMGVVYRAVEEEAGREVALKMLRPGLAEDAGVRWRFAQEAKAMGALDHPCVLPIYRVGEHAGLPFFTMKLAEGGALAGRVANFRGQWHAVAALMAQVAEAVHHAHGRGLLHRDLKPANILFDAESHPYVADFGLVKWTAEETGMTLTVALMGTPQYLAPEVATQDARAASVASDVWSLGGVAYELLAGRPPFQAEGLGALLRQIAEDEAPPLEGVPRDLATVVLKCLRKASNQRYPSAGALAEDLRRWLRGEPVSARRATWTERLRWWVRRNPAPAAAVATLSLAAMVTLGLQMHSAQVLRVEKTGALMAQVVASRMSGRLDLRSDALAAAAMAASFAPSDALRDEATTLLTLPAWQPVESLPTGAMRRLVVSPDHRFRVVEGKQGLAIQDEVSGDIHVMEALQGLAAEPTWISASGERVLVLRRGSNGLRYAVYATDRKALLRPWSEPIHSLGLSDDGQRLAVCQDGRSQELSIVDARSGEVLTTLRTESPGEHAPSFSPDGRLLVTSHPDRTRLLGYELPSGRQVFSLVGPAAGPGPRRVAWRRDGRALVLCGRTADVRLIELGGPAGVLRERLLHGHEDGLLDAAWHPSGRWLATCAADNSLRLWEVASGTERLNLPLVQGSLSFSKDGTSLLAHSLALQRLDDYAFTVSPVFQDAPLPSGIRPEQRARPDAVLHPGGRHGWINSGVGAFAFSFADARFTALPRTRSAIKKLLLDDQAETLMVLEDAGAAYGKTASLEAWNAMAEVPKATVCGAFSQATNILAVASFHAGPSRCLVSVGAADGRDGFRTLAPPPGLIFDLAISPDARWVVGSAAFEPGWLAIWDTQAATAPLVVSTFRSRQKLAFDPTGETLLASQGGGVTALRLGSWEPLWETTPHGDSSDDSALCVSGNGRYLFTSTAPHGIAVFETTTGRRLATLNPATRRKIHALATDHEGARLVVVTTGETVQFWDLRKLRAELKERGLDWQAADLPPMPD
jgi:WD40 repeat protein